MISSQPLTLANSVRERLPRNEVPYTLSVKLIRSVELPTTAKTAGFDGILIDMEHSSFDLDTTGQLCTAALYAGIPLLSVRLARILTMSRESSMEVPWVSSSLLFGACKTQRMSLQQESFSLSDLALRPMDLCRQVTATLNRHY